MKFANIIVDISLEKLDRTFQYRVPEELQGILKEGMQVRIPFGNGGRTLTGYVLELTDTCEWDEKKLKPILGLAEKGIRLEGQLIALAAWMRRTYGSTMNQALKTVLPVKKSVQEKISRKVRLAVTREEAEAALAEMERKHQTAPDPDHKSLAGANRAGHGLRGSPEGACLTAATARKLMELGLIRIESDTIFRNPVRPSEVQAHPFTLYPAQQAIVEDVAARAAAGDLRPSLIHGVTGSGKTEVYMELIAAVLEQGKEAVVLIPEIALTFQTVLRFYRRFGDQVSIIHSKLSAGERYDQFERARRGEVKVMIGPRSALFTPFPRLGVIVIDEEHEGSYKSENAPRYHAREAAIERARMCGAFVVLGSATPSVDSYERTKEGLYRLYELPFRVENRAMPETEVVDLREELRMGNRSIFSAR